MEKIKYLNKTKNGKGGLTIQKKKVLTFLTIALLIIAAFYAGYTIASPSNTFTISSGVYPGAASYTIWRDGDYYYAKNAYGAIDYSGTDAASVIQSAISALMTRGGKVLVKAGTYILTKAVQLYSNTVLEGEGNSTVLKVGDVVESVIASTASSGQKNVFVADASNFKVGQQVFIGTKSSSSTHWEINRIAGISGNTLTMEQNLRNTYSTSEYVYTAFHAIEAYNSQYVIVKNLAIDGNTANNYYFSQYDTAVTAQCYDEGVGWIGAVFKVQNGVHLSNCSNSVVEGVKTINVVGWGGIALIQTTYSRILNCETTYGVRHGILLDYNANNNVVSNCYSGYNGKTDETFPRHNVIFEWCSNNVMANSVIVSGVSGSDGFYGYYMTNTNIVGNTLINIAGTNLWLTGGGTSELSENVVVEGNVFIGNNVGAGTSLNLDITTRGISVIGNVFYSPYIYYHVTQLGGKYVLLKGNHFSGGRYMIEIYSTSAQDICIEGNTIRNMMGDNTYPSYAFYLQGSDIDVKENTIYGDNTGHYGVYICSTASNVNVIGNTLLNLKNAAVYNAGATNVICKGNIGYVTEKSGTATIPSGQTSVTVNHGLASTPTTVVVTGSTSDTADAYVSAKTSTTFTITVPGPVGGDRTVYWYAEYRP